MSTLLWIVLWSVLAFLVVQILVRWRSHVSPRAFPPWMTPLLEVPWRNREKILDRAGVAAGERVLEIGPGAGFISERALERLGERGRLVCLDIQLPMLRKARARVADRAWLVCASGSRLPFRDGAFDRAFLIHVLGEIPDQRGAVQELARVIRSGGELAVGEGLVDPDYVRAPALLRMAGEAGFRAGPRFGSFADFTQRLARR